MFIWIDISTRPFMGSRMGKYSILINRRPKNLQDVSRDHLTTPIKCEVDSVTYKCWNPHGWLRGIYSTSCTHHVRHVVWQTYNVHPTSKIYKYIKHFTKLQNRNPYGRVGVNFLYVNSRKMSVWRKSEGEPTPGDATWLFIYVHVM